MKYEVTLKINCPRSEVIKKMDNVDNMKHWQRGLMSLEHLSGTPGEEGAKMKLSYKMGKRNMELIETVTKRNFPEEFHSTYDSKGMHNIQENYFTETEDGNTIWTSKCEFVPTGFMMRMMAFLMPGAFKKQSKKYMIDFKNFVENGESVTQSN